VFRGLCFRRRWNPGRWAVVSSGLKLKKYADFPAEMHADFSGPQDMNIRWFAKTTLARVLPLRAYLAINARAAARDIASKRRWEVDIEYLPNFVHGGVTVIDVGGNHGLYTFHLSRIVGPAGRVHTFEPLPPNLGILSHTIKRHRLGNVTVHAQACGKESETATFGVPMRQGVPMLWIAKQGEDGMTFPCEIVKLDEAIFEKVSFLKIDVEGAELFVLQGARRILRESRPVILFEALDQTQEYGYPQQEVFDFLSNLGYRFFTGKGGGAALEACQGFSELRNYFCIPDSFR
jgi:FkbM family methyltransferase